MATAVEIALELFNPYPVGTSESNEIFNFVLDSSLLVAKGYKKAQVPVPAPYFNIITDDKA